LENIYQLTEFTGSKHSTAGVAETFRLRPLRRRKPAAIFKANYQRVVKAVRAIKKLTSKNTGSGRNGSTGSLYES
jgi:hypothetical protein